MFGALSTGILVLAIGFVYGITGTNIGESIKAMASLDPELIPIGLVAIALFIAGFGFKMGLVPFHMWLPDAYEGSPTTIGALLFRRHSRFCRYPGSSPRNVCTKSRLDNNSCGDSSFHNDFGKFRCPNSKSLTQNPCLFKHSTSRLHTHRLSDCAVF